MKAIVVACLLCPEQCDAIIAKLVRQGYTVLPWINDDTIKEHYVPTLSGADDLVSKMMVIKIEHTNRYYGNAKVEVWAVLDEYKHFGKFMLDVSDDHKNVSNIGNGTIKSDRALRQEHAEKFT